MDFKKTQNNIQTILEQITQKSIQHFKKHKTILFSQSKKNLIMEWLWITVVIIMVIWPKSQQIHQTKSNFYVQTKSIEKFSDEIQINKPWKIIWNEEIIISSQVMWWIKKINIKEWQEVWQNTNLIEIKDTIANYGIMVQKAKNALNSARLQYAQQKNQIEQWINNSKLAIEKFQTTLETAKKLWDQNIRWAKNNLDNANSQKNALTLQLDSEKTSLTNLITDVLHQTDTILWVTTKYKSYNDSYEIYLSAKKTSYKLTAKKQLLNLYKQKDTLININTDSSISNEELKNNTNIMNTIYKDISELLNTMENIYKNSVSSIIFPQTKIDGLITANNMLQTSTQANYAHFTAYKQQIDAALINGENGEIILWNEMADIWYQSTIASTQQQISDATIWLKTAQTNYETAIQNQNNNLWLLASNITNAELAYKEALKQYEKLIIKAPITGTIWKILVDKWQEVRIWMPLLTITNNSDPIVEIWITNTEYNKINSWSMIKIEYMWKTLSWKIISISSQAWWNWLFNAIIKLNKKVDIIWDTAQIKISSKNNKLTLPLNIVHPLDKDNWYIYILSWSEPDILNIKLWKIRWDNIEIQSKIPNNTKIITNDISNYNPTIHNLIIR